METVLMKVSPQEHIQQVWMYAQAGLMTRGFQTQSCLLVARLHSLLDLRAVMLLFQVKNCVKLAAQEMKTLLNSYQTRYRDEM